MIGDPPRPGTCESASHGRGYLGRIVRETPRTVYAERVCEVCRRVQGIARVRK